MERKKEKSILQIRTSRSNKVNIDKFFGDINKVVNKHSGTKENISVLGDKSETDEGFFLFFLRRNEKLDQNRLQVVSFGQNITTIDLINSLETALTDLVKPSNRIDYKA